MSANQPFEFEAFPEYGDNGTARAWESVSVRWTGKVTLNLAFVSSASRYMGEATSVTMFGGKEQYIVKMDYWRFTSMWAAALAGRSPLEVT